MTLDYSSISVVSVLNDLVLCKADTIFTVWATVHLQYHSFSAGCSL